MVRFILSFLFVFSFHARADFLGLKIGEGIKSKIPPLVEKMKSIDIENGALFEDQFNQSIKNIETALEEEKLFCAGEAADAQGKVIAKDQKQLCFRNLKANYLEAIEVIFNIKKKYLGIIHQRQLEKLSEINKKFRAEVEKSF